MNNKTTISRIKDLDLKEEKSKIKIFSIREIKSNPFKYFDEESNRNINLENKISMDYKTEMAMEYELIYNSYFFDQ